jgi:hypothetical protein
MTGTLIHLGMNVILWKILVKVMFAKKLAGQNFLPCPALAALQGQQGRAKKINSPCRAEQGSRAALPCDSLWVEPPGERGFFEIYAVHSVTNCLIHVIVY